ncbi:MAG: hypothetical protein QOJ31_240 [Gaiellales bacterium]|nr:hypothetical protein [Gaiellales bacterium]
MNERRIGWWTHRQQRLGRSGGDPQAALRDVIGVYSAHPSAPLTLHARSPSLDAAAFRALPALRLPAMRGSIHLLPAETAHRTFRALPEPAASGVRRLKTFGLSPQRYADLRAAVLAVATDPRTARELRAQLGIDGELSGVVGQMTREGALIRVGARGLRSNELRYLACEIPDADRDRSLAWLAGEYLRAFGPVRRSDFAWWAGVSATRADAALAGHETDELDDGLLLLRAQRVEFERVTSPRGMVDLLPKWDCYTMGYPLAGRGRFAAADVVSSLYDHRGDGLPAVLVEGRAAGTWALRPGSGVAFDVNLFEPAGAKLKQALDGALERVRELLA